MITPGTGASPFTMLNPTTLSSSCSTINGARAHRRRRHSPQPRSVKATAYSAK
jgi:hypothetical protein